MVRKAGIVQCLNPVGIQNPVDTYPLAPRLESLDGREVYLSVCGEPDIWIPLEKKLRTDFPNVNWRTKKTYHHTPTSTRLTEEEMKTADAVIQGVAW